MKLCVLGDTHFGMRNDNVAFHEYYRRFYHETLFPYLRHNGINDIIQLGDLFDRRKVINFNSLYLAKKHFFDYLEKYDLFMWTFPGNHDIFYKNTLEVNSIELLLGEYISNARIMVINEPSQLGFGEMEMDIIPWICESNADQVKQYIENSTSPVCMGHFQIAGFEMDKGNICLDGIDRSLLGKYEMVLSGHFHHKSQIGNIHYVGSPGEMTWLDYDDPRGFHILDTETLKLEFIRNPFKMHEKIIWDGSETKESVKHFDYAYYKGKIVKVIITKTYDLPKEDVYETFIKSLEAAVPLEINIVESTVDNKTDDNFSFDEADDTVTSISKYVDGVDTNLDKTKVVEIIRDFYTKAQDMDGVKGLDNV